MFEPHRCEGDSKAFWKKHKWLKTMIDTNSSNWQLSDVDEVELNTSVIDLESRKLTTNAFKDNKEGIQLLANMREI